MLLLNAEMNRGSSLYVQRGFVKTHNGFVKNVKSSTGSQRYFRTGAEYNSALTIGAGQIITQESRRLLPRVMSGSVV